MANQTLTFDLFARDRASGTFKKVGKAVDDTDKKFTGFSSRLGLFSRVGPRALTVFATGFAAIGVGAATMGIKTAASLEQANIAFSTLLGSGKKAQDFLNQLKKFAAKTPFELPGLVDASRQLIGVGENAKDVIPTLQAWGDASGALGLSQDQFNRALLAVTQSMSKGKVQAEELMQITEAGIPIWPLLSKALHKPVPELQKLASGGKLLAKDVFPALEKQMEKDYGGAMSKQSQTLTGIWSTLMDTINLGLADTLKPLLPFMKTALSGAIGFFGDVLGTLPDIVKKVGPPIGDFIDFVTKKAVPTIVGFGKTLVDKFIPIDKIKGTFKTLNTIISDFFEGVSGDQDRLSIGRMFEEFEPSDAKKMGQRLHDFINAGIAAIDWKQIGTSLGGALIVAIESIARGGARLGNAFADLLGKLDWFAIGKQVGMQAAEFGLGFTKTLFDGVIKAVKEHPLDSVLFLAFIVPIGRLSGLLAKAVAKIPILRIFAPILQGVAKIGGLVETRLIGPVLKAIGHFAAAMARGFLAGFRLVFPNIGAKFGEWLQLLPTRLGIAAIELREKAAAMMRGLGNKILSFGGYIGRVMGQIVGRIVHPFVGAPKWLIQAGRNIIFGLIKGIFNEIQGVGGWIKRNVVNPIINAVKNYFGIHSPSTVMASIGGNLIKGLIRGIIGQNPVATITKIFGGMPEALGYLVKKGLVSVANLPGKALKALGSVAGKIGGFFAGLFGGGGGGGNKSNIALGQAMAANFGWVGAAWEALKQLWMNESGWNTFALNKSSGAYGIPQSLPASKMASAGSDYLTNPATQIAWGLNYIWQRYGNPINALSQWMSRSPHWYGFGGAFGANQWIGVGDRGPELVKFNRAGRVYSPEQSRRIVATPGASSSALVSGGNGRPITVQLTRADHEAIGRIVLAGISGSGVASARRADLYARAG